MTFGSRASQRSPMRPAASWEAPRAGMAKPSRSDNTFIKGQLTLSGAFSFLRENGRRILLLSLALFGLGTVVLMVLPVRFAATALVVVDPREQRVTTDQDVLPGIGQDAAALQSLIEIAKSDGFLRPLIEQLKIADDQDIAGGQTDTTRLLDKFRSRLDISRRGLTYVIAIAFTSDRPDKAAHYANAVAEAFVASQGRTRTEATDEAADWLKNRLKTLNDRLRASEDAVAAFRLEHKIVNAGRESTTQQLRVTDLTQQVSTARARTEEARSRYEQAQRDLKANVDSPAKQDLLSMLRAQRSALNDQIAQKKAVFGDRHPDLVISYSQLNDLNRQIEIERKKNIDTTKSEYEAQLGQQNSLENQLKAVETQMLVDGQAQVRLQELQRDAEANKNIYEQFLSRFKSTNEQRSLQTSQTKLASLATPPLRPTRPPLALLLAAWALASLLITTAAVAMTKAMSDDPDVAISPSYAAPEQAEPPKVQKSTNALPPLRVLPNFPVWSRIPDLTPGSGKAIWQRPMAAAHEPDVAPYLRPVLEKIDVVAGSGCKVALVLSVGKSAGGNTVARALNRAAVNGGKLSALIQVLPEFGVATVDEQDGATAAAVQSVNELLGVGRGAVARPADDIRSDFDLIILHASSLAFQPEAISLAEHADLIILVARASELDSAAMKRTTAALSRFDGVPSGLIINYMPLSSPASYAEATF
ncbi:GumC family protein [Bradyrhizobium diazoefficiens]|uniref:GumC family protein n=1 Tax=Bradyrhizobium diazoefficiens TaxID=1355477 RepID=UPI0019093BD2|nr:GumC family protein [Bradyrhizobium diazoefficiens]MBK3659708.1 GumC family protein [Bradyrhizobium diazoefficiens]